MQGLSANPRSALMSRIFILRSMLVASLLLLTGQAVAAESWRTVSSMVKHRAEATLVDYDGDAWLFNGFTFGIKLQPSVERYDVARNRWTLLGNTNTSHSVGTAVTHNGAVVVGDELWSIGGRIGNHPGLVSNKVWIYGFKTNRWRQGPTLPAPFAAGGAALVDNRIHVFGGIDSRAKCDIATHRVYDLSHPGQGWQNLTGGALMPSPRNHFSTVVVDGIIYAVGGQYGHDNCTSRPGTPQLKLVHSFDPKSNRWQRRADLPGPQSHAEPGTFTHDGRIYMVGGRVNGKQVFVYEPARNRWQVRGELTLKKPLLAPGARIFDNKLYLFGGGSPFVSQPIRDTQVIALPAVDRVTTASDSNDNDNSDGSAVGSGSDGPLNDGPDVVDTNVVVHRINLGGPAVTDAAGRQWSADTSSRASLHGMGSSSTYSVDATVSIDDAAIPNATPAAVFESTRWSGDRSTGLNWNFPVSPGDHEVRLYFAEIWPGAFSRDARRFDVLIENLQVESGIDIHAAAGSRQAMVRSYRVSSDAHLSVSLRHVIQNPALNAIEIVRLGSAGSETDPGSQADDDQTAGGVETDDDTSSGQGGSDAGSGSSADSNTDSDSGTDSDSTAGTGRVAILAESTLDMDFGTVQVGSDMRRTLTLSNTGNESLAIREITVQGASSSVFEVAVPESRTIAPGGALMLDVTYRPREPGDSEAVLAISHDAPTMLSLVALGARAVDADRSIVEGTVRLVHRINIGGPTIDAVDGLPWNADLDERPSEFLDTFSRRFTTTQNITIAGDAVASDVPATLFQTARWSYKRDQGLAWKFPATSGRYEVRLYFSETWPGAFGTGKRLFDILVDGQTLANEVDMYELSGRYTSLVRAFVIDNDDDAIDVALRHVTQNPMIMGIEVLECLAGCPSEL